MIHKMCCTGTIVLLLAGPAADGQRSAPSSTDASAFMGTWVLKMTNPPGAQETVRIWDENGTAAASVQAGRFPPITVSGMLKDGDMLVLSLTRFENGKPIWAIIALTLDVDTMKMAQMLESSQTIKRGSGKKQPQ